MEEPAPEQKEAIKVLVARQIALAVKLSAVHVELRWALVMPYDPGVYLSGMLLSRVPHVGGGHMWVRDSYATTKMKFGRLEHQIEPMQALHQQRFFSGEIAKAKKRAREVIITLLLVRHRLKLSNTIPLEVLLLILGYVNEKECAL